MTLKEKHEKAIELLEAIEYFEKRSNSCIESAYGFAGTNFPQFKSQLLNNADTCGRAADRLRDCYTKLIKTL